jgi:FtsZ-interacting cell division protein ZipA
MLEFLSDNLFIVIAVVVIIVVRMIGASRKRAAASREEEAAAENYSSNDEDDDDRTVSLGHWEVEKQTQPVPQPTFTRKTLEESSAQSSLTSRFEAPLFSSSSEKTPVTAEVSSAEKAAKPVATADLSHGTKASGLSSLDHLPVLKKAVVFSEILSPPKAIRD